MLTTASQPAPTPPPFPTRAANWFRYRGWRWVVGLLLLAVGLMNIYPFVWMMGTSFKSTSEASNNLAQPYPVSKYYLTEAGRAFVDERMDRLSYRQLKVLALLQTRREMAADRGDAPPTIDVAGYAVEASAPTEEAAAELAALAEQGLVEVVPRGDESDATPTGDEAGPLYALTPLAASAFIADFNARQLLVLRFLASEDVTQAERDAVPAGASVTAHQAAVSTGLDRKLETVADTPGLTDAAVDYMAAEELNAMLEAGLLEWKYVQWINYWIVFKDMRFYLKVLTTIVLTAGVVVLTLLITSMFGYALARLSFPGKGWVLMLLIAGAVAPGEAVIIPIFRMLQGLHLLDGLWGMVLWMSGVGIGNALLMAAFFLTLPKEVEEAATIDGAGPFRTFFDVALPMARPIVMTIGLFAFIGAWNNFLLPFLCTQASPNMQPLAVAVYAMQQQSQGKWELINVAAAFMILPVIVLFLLLQRYIVSAIAVGAVKG